MEYVICVAIGILIGFIVWAVMSKDDLRIEWQRDRENRHRLIQNDVRIAKRLEWFKSNPEKVGQIMKEEGLL